MPGERKYYVFCDDNCKFETMTKTQILQAISKAVNIGVVDDVQATNGIIEKNKGKLIQLWVGTQSEYNNIAKKESNVLYIISDDTSKDDLIAKIDKLAEDVTAFGNQGIELFDKAIELEAAQNNVDSEVDSISGIVADVEAEISEYEGAVAREQTELQLAYQVKQRVGNLEKAITGWSEEQFHESVTFNQPKTFTLLGDISYYNKLVIVIKTPYSLNSAFYYTTEIIPEYYGTDLFLLYTQIMYNNRFYDLRVFCKFEDNKFIIDEVKSDDAIKNINLELIIYGIV